MSICMLCPKLPPPSGEGGSDACTELSKPLCASSSEPLGSSSSDEKGVARGLRAERRPISVLGAGKSRRTDRALAGDREFRVMPRTACSSQCQSVSRTQMQLRRKSSSSQDAFCTRAMAGSRSLSAIKSNSPCVLCVPPVGVRLQLQLAEVQK